VSVLTRWFVAAAFLVALGAIPLPYYLIAPGTAVDLTHAITVSGHHPPSDRYYLTDVTLQRASAIRLVNLALPGVKLQAIGDVAPAGSRTLDAISTSDMETSQETAAVVAERAAGYTVPIPPLRTAVLFVDPASQAGQIFRSGDIITSVDGHAIETNLDLRARVAAHRAGQRVRVGFEHAGFPQHADVRLVAIDGHARIGISTQTLPAAAHLAVPVRFGIDDIGGPSGGLMFALEIYRALRPGHVAPERKIAGTGTIAFDGRVGPIEGTQQKLIAAKRAGASVFLVPRENYDEIKDERGVRIVPVDTFADALRALSG